MSDPLAPLLAEVKAGKVRPLYLCWGEEFLVRRDAEALAQALVPDAAAGLNFAVLDAASPREIAAELMTLPLFPGRKVALVRDPEFLAPKKGRVDALGKVREAWKAGRRKESARRLLALVARAGWGVAEVDPSVPGAPPPEAWKEELGITLADADLDWLREMAAFIREEGVTAPESDASPLLGALERGLPEGHALIIATTDVDPRHPLLKVAQKQGAVLERKVGGRLRDLDLSGAAKSFLEGTREAARSRRGGGAPRPARRADAAPPVRAGEAGGLRARGRSSAGRTWSSWWPGCARRSSSSCRTRCRSATSPRRSATWTRRWSTGRRR